MKKISKLLLSILMLFVCLCGCSDKEDEKEKEPVNTMPKDVVVSFKGVGDNLIHDTIYLDALQEDGTYDFTGMYKSVKKDMKDADIAFINQETMLGGVELGLSGYPTFNSPTEIAKNLKSTGFNLVNLATNHSMDKYQRGINNTLDAFRNAKGMVFDGIYDSQEAFDTIPTFEIKGITFSFLAYTYGTNGIPAENSYSVSYFDEARISQDVKEAKEISDVVIVSAHWGDENSFTPNAFQKSYAQLFADLGVDVVIGTHPHVIQPIEWVEGVEGNKTLVVYSLGNFIGGMLTTNNAINGMIEFDFVQDHETKEISVENVNWVPMIIHFEGNQNNILAERWNYKSYKVSEYSDDLASKHVLNGYGGNVVSIDYIMNIQKQVISEEFLEVKEW